MRRRLLIMLACGVAVLMVLVVVTGISTRGLAKRDRRAAARELAGLTRTTERFQEQRAEFANLLARGERVLRNSDALTHWTTQLEDVESKLAAATKDRSRIEAILANGERKDRQELANLVHTLARTRAVTTSATTNLLAKVKARVTFMDNRDALRAELRKQATSFESVDLASARTAVARAAADWPNKKADLELRLAAIERLAPEGRAAWARYQSEDEKASRGASFDIEAMFADRRTIERNAAEVTEGPKRLVALTQQLYRAWDRILVDMEVRESGSTPATFLHKYKTVQTTIKDPQARTNEATAAEEWRIVDRRKYAKFERNLGMTVASKEAGYYDEEATEKVQPTGYSKVGNRTYGRWEQRNGANVWVFYGQYALLRDLLWGHRGYRPIPRRRYDDYRSYRRRGSTYYGRDAAGRPEYGTTGTRTASEYANSKYKRANGYKNSRYKRSQGGYRNSRYQKGRSSSSYRSRSSGGFSSRRSGGYSSSRTRFGGFGK